MARATMAALILRVRDLINDAPGASQTWTDDLNDVFPGSMMANFSDCTSANTIDLSKSFDLSRSSRSGTDSTYIVIGKVRFANCLSFGLSSFCIAILRIIGAGSKEKMVRANTRRIITVVTDGKIIRNRAIRLLVGKAMSTNGTPIVSHGKQSMTKASFATCPKPAVGGFINPFPKSYCAILAVSYIGAFIRAIVANLCSLSFKNLATYNACVLDLVFKPLGIADGRAKTLHRIATLRSDERLSTCLTDKFDWHKIYLHMFDASLYHTTICSRQNTLKVLGGMTYAS